MSSAFDLKHPYFLCGRGSAAISPRHLVFFPGLSGSSNERGGPDGKTSDKGVMTV